MVGDLYEAELAEALGDLAESFEEWRRGEILPSELSERIHEYHQNANREIWKRYNPPAPEAWLVARGFALGFIDRSEIPADLWPFVERNLGMIGAEEEEWGCTITAAGRTALPMWTLARRTAEG